MTNKVTATNDSSDSNGATPGQPLSSPALSAAQVADYLRAHPEFFESQTELLAELKIPHESGKAISLLERQVVILRERGQEARQKLG